MAVKRRLATGALVVLIAFLAADQIAHRTVLAGGSVGGVRVAPFDPPLFCQAQREFAAELRAEVDGGSAPGTYRAFDPELGWCPAPNSGSDGISFDESSARVAFDPLPPTKARGERRIVTVGCSFTLGGEVGNEEAWPALLDQALEGSRVVNLGVGGYGIDQAFLRWQRDGMDFDPDEAWLGWVPQVSPRVTAFYTPARRHWRPRPAFKPRFAVDGSGEIVLVPNAVRSLDQLVGLLSDQRAFLEALADDDPWIGRPRAAWQPAGSHWMHGFATTRLWLTWRANRARPDLTEIADEASLVHRVVKGVVLAMRDDVERRGKRFRLVVLPGSRDLYEADSMEDPPAARVLESIREAGVEILDLTPPLLADGVLEKKDGWQPGGHYSPSTNSRVAAWIAEQVRREQR